MLTVKGMRFPIEVIMVCLRWYAAYPLSCRHLEEMVKERGVSVDHPTVSRWGIRFLPLLEKIFRKHKRLGWWKLAVGLYQGQRHWEYLYHAVGRDSKTIDFLLTAKRDKTAAKRFFNKTMQANCVPEKVAMDKRGGNKAAIDEINASRDIPVAVRQVKYLNNIVDKCWSIPLKLAEGDI